MNEDFRIVLEIDESDSGTTNIPLKEERLFLKNFMDTIVFVSSAMIIRMQMH